MKTVDLKPYERIVAKRNAEYRTFQQRRKSLPENERECMEVGIQLVVEAIKYRKSSTSAEVIKAYLHEHGFEDWEARSVLWAGVSRGEFKFDNDWNIKR